MHFLLESWHSSIWPLVMVCTAIALSFAVRTVLFAFLNRAARRDPDRLKSSIIRHTRTMSWWIFPLLALVAALQVAPLPEDFVRPLQHVVGLGLMASVAWLAIMISEVVSDMVAARYRMDVADNLLARKVQTQLRVLHRVIIVVVMVVTLALMLMTFPAIRQIGTSLLASAGLAGLIVGMAMRPTLSSLMAGIQIALTQPIRIDDAVVVEGEWGWIEDIGSTYVVVRIWDLRRLVLPLSYFIEHPFQNWTRNSADLLGSVFLWVDYTAPVEELRRELSRILKSTDKWKGGVNSLQVSDATERTIQLRALMDARDSSSAWDLRCYVREKLVEFLRERYPQCLPRIRGELGVESHNSDGSDGSSAGSAQLHGTRA
jgi:small-conductance mechanosensitive channel